MKTILQIHKSCGLGLNRLWHFCAAILTLILGTGPGYGAAYTINVASGTAGSPTINQSYNETRAVDVTVLSPVNLAVSSMTLSGINGSGTAEA